MPALHDSPPHPAEQQSVGPQELPAPREESSARPERRGGRQLPLPGASPGSRRHGLAANGLHGKCLCSGKNLSH